jgi:peptidyl-prolyl cis-trans isomerase SurA
MGLFRTPAAIVIGTLLLAGSTLAQTHPAAPESPYGGTTVEEIIARVNDQIITRSDYDRALKEIDAESRQQGKSMQEISESHRDLLRGLIDQQLWLSKGKELGITGETELINKLNDIRKQYNMETMEDLEKEAQEQGVSFEDFKANIRNGIVTQLVMRQEVGSKINVTPGESERYYEAHKQDYAQPESVRLSEILVSTATPAAAAAGAAQPDEQALLAAAKSKADNIEAKLQAGGDFAQLARSFSDGQTAASGGDLGQYQRGSLAKVLEDKTFVLKSGQYTEPIRTKQGYVILKVVQHIEGGAPPYKDVQDQVAETLFMKQMEPAIREYLTKMREQAFLDVKPGFTDTGASARETKPVYSAYVPPAPKKKKKVVRTRFRETTHSFRQKSKPSAAEATAEPAHTAPAAAAAAPAKKGKKNKKAEPVNLATMKPGKKEKIRFGQAPTQTLPGAAEGKVEDAGAGAGATVASNAAAEPVNPLEDNAKPAKTRFSERAKTAKTGKKAKRKGPQPDKLAPEAPDAAEVADRQTQAGPLGLAGDTATKKKKKATTVGNKTRLRKKKKDDASQSQDVPLASAPAPQPASAPAPKP